MKHGKRSTLDGGGLSDLFPSETDRDPGATGTLLTPSDTYTAASESSHTSTSSHISSVRPSSSDNMYPKAPSTSSTSLYNVTSTYESETTSDVYAPLGTPSAIPTSAPVQSANNNDSSRSSQVISSELSTYARSTPPSSVTILTSAPASAPPLPSATSVEQAHSTRTWLTPVIAVVVALVALVGLTTYLVCKRRIKKGSDPAEENTEENDNFVEPSPPSTQGLSVPRAEGSVLDAAQGRNDDTVARPHIYSLNLPYSTVPSSVDLTLGGNYDSRLSGYGGDYGIGDIKVVPATPTAYERDIQDARLYPLEQSSISATVVSSLEGPFDAAHGPPANESGVHPFSASAFPNNQPPPSQFSDDHPSARVRPAGAVPRTDIPSLYSTSIYGHTAMHRLSIHRPMLPRPPTHAISQQAAVPDWRPVAGLPLQTTERADSPITATPPCMWLISERGAVQYTPNLLSGQLGSHEVSVDTEGDPWLRMMEGILDPTRQHIGDARTLPLPPPPPPYTGRE